MNLVAFIKSNKQKIIEEWARQARARLSLPAKEEPQLLNDMPQFLDEVVELLELPAQDWPAPQSARNHGRHRLDIGADISALAEEFGLVAEVVFSLAENCGVSFSTDDKVLLARAAARGTAESVKEYAQLRNDELERQANEQFSFVAHELRTPLNAVSLAAQLIRQQLPQAPDALDRLDRSLATLIERLDNFLIDARLRGSVTPGYEGGHSGQLVEQVLEEVEMLAHRKSVHLQVEVDDFELSADRKLMASALGNLVTNAIKFTPSEGVVAIRTHASGDRALFSVEDQCGGLPQSVEQLFTAGHQRSDDRSGFGLGLRIVKQAVEAHRGEVTVDNHPGKGCCFSIDVPRERPPAEAD